MVPLRVYEKAKTFKLAADKKKRPTQEEGDGKQEEILLDKNVPVFVEGGQYADAYGRVQLIDDVARKCTVRLTGGEKVEIVAQLLTPISEKEFTDAGKIISKWNWFN